VVKFWILVQQTWDGLALLSIQ